MEMKNSEGKRGTELLAVVSRINEEMLSSPNDKKAHEEHCASCCEPGAIWCVSSEEREAK